MSDMKRGDIYYIERYNSDNTGSEQWPGRPAIIVSNDRNNANSTVLEVVYLTTQPKHDLPTHVTIRSADRESIALCEQVTPVALERFGTYKGHVTGKEMENIDIALAISLGLTAYPAEQPSSCEKVSPPVPDTRLAAAEARCAMLQQMYDALLNRLIGKAG